MAVKEIKKVKFRKQAEVFNCTEAAKDDLVEAGEKALVSLYGGGDEERLDALRYRKFCEKISKGTSHVQPQTLPPTSAAAVYHSLRVYFQIMQWKGANSNMKPEEWG